MMLKQLGYSLSLALGLALAWPLAADEKSPPSMSEEAAETEHDDSVFGADPSYDDKPYNIDDQLKIVTTHPFQPSFERTVALRRLEQGALLST